MNKNISRGKNGENLAAEFLEKRDFKIIERNWRYSRLGEIDIIAMDKDILVFIEVKTRTSNYFGHPIESITAQKMNKIIKLAQAYIDSRANLISKGYRFDAVSVILKQNPKITYFKDIYQF